jgi:hypothetical protein
MSDRMTQRANAGPGVSIASVASRRTPISAPALGALNSMCCAGIVDLVRVHH